MSKIYRTFVKKFIVVLLSILLVFPPYALSPFIPTAEAAITGTFTANETTANVTSSTIPAVTFVGGANAVAATTTITITDALDATATDHSITIDGVVIDLGTSALTATQVASAIAAATFTTGTSYVADGAYTVTNPSGANVTFTRNAVGATGNNGGNLVTDATYTKTNEVKASVTLTVASVPANAETITIGSCVVTFDTGSSDELNCNDNAAVIDTTTHNDANGVATALRSLTNVSDAAHGALTVSGATTDVIFTTTGSETSATNISFTDNTSTDITPTATTTGVILVNGTVPAITFAGGVTAAAATRTITIPAGLVANASDHSITIDGVVIDLGTATQTATQVASTIDAADFSSKDYDVTSTGATVTFTKNAVGSAGNVSLTIEDASYGAKAQVVTFTPANVTAGETFRGTINSTNYDYLATSGNTVSTVVAALATSMDANASVACVDTSSTTITCTSSTPGTAFTYAASVLDITSPTAFTLGTVTTTGGTITTGKWNATNTGIDITVPVANDPTLTGGTIQLKASRDASTYVNVGSAYTILVGDLNSTKTLSLTATQFEGISGFTEGDTITFKALITDSNTNSTLSVASATTLYVDQLAPTVSSITTKDSNLDGKVDTATIVFSDTVLDSSFVASNFTIGGTTATSISTGTGNDNTFDVLVSGGVTGTGAKTVAYTPGSGTDNAGNALGSFSQTSTDAANPALLSAQTKTTSTIDVTFSEALNAASVATSDFSVASNTVSGVTTPSSTVVRLTLGSTIGTGSTPAVTLGGNGVNDVNGNTLASAGPTTPSDGITPVLSSVSISSNNALSALFAKVGAFATLSFTTSENITTTPVVTIGGNSVTVTGGPTSWTTAYTFVSNDSEGVVPFTINFTDPTGNAGSQVTTTTDATSVTFDNTAPTTPGTPSTTTPTNTSQSWSWSASSDTSGINNYYYRITGSLTAALTAIANVTSYVTNLSEGVYNFFVTARDVAGNLSIESAAGTVTVDNTNPTVTADNASSSWQTVNPTITLSVSDAGGAGLVANRVRYNWDATANATTGTVFVNGDQVNVPSEGTHTLNMYAEDAAGNSNTFNGTYKVDTVDPTVSATGASSSWQASIPTITVSASDATSGLSTVKYAWDASASTGTVTSNGANLTSTYPAEGNHTLNLYVQDASGRTSTFTGSYKVDTISPVISGVSINNVTTSNNSFLKNGNTVNVTATISDANQTSITTSMLRADLSQLGAGSSIPPNTYNTTTGLATWTNLVIGTTANNTLSTTVTASDAAGNTATPASDTIIQDNTAPTGSITAPANNAVTNVNPTFTATGSDTNGVASVLFQYKTSAAGSYTNLNTDSTAPYVADWTGVTLTTNTVYNLQTVTTDNAGNQTTTNGISFTYDTTPPVLSITAPLNGTSSTSTVPVDLTTNENATCSYILDSGSATPLTTTGTMTHSHTLSSLAAGAHTLQLRCVDTATNITTSSTISWTVLNSSGSTISGGTSNVSLDSNTSGQADLPSGITSITLSDTTSLDLSGGTNTVSGGNITVGGSSIALNNFTSGNLTNANLSVAQNVGGQSVVIGQAVTLQSGTDTQPIILTNSGLSTASVSIPDGTTILAPAGWDGTLMPPRTGSATGTASGFSIGSTIIEVGSPNSVLLLDTPATIVLPGVTSNVAYKAAGSSNWVQITTVCSGSYASPTAPAFPGECYITNGANTKVYTYHFTTFAALAGTSTPSTGLNTSGVSTTGVPTCSDTKPGSAPTLLSVRGGQNSVTLTWSRATNPVSYYLVAYGTQSGVMQYGNPNAGNAETTSYTINGLSGGQTYYFQVRAGNGCMPGDYSNELSATPNGGYISGPAEGFQAGVLGATTDKESEASKEAEMKEKKSGEVMGEENEIVEQVKKISSSKTNSIAAIVALLLIIAGASWFMRRKK